MRGTDPANISWTKVCTFEVNTTRRPIVSTGINATASSSLPVYAGNGYSLMTDGNEATYFWSVGEGRAGDTVQLDLGSVTAVTRIIFKSGVPAHTADYIENGELSYSRADLTVLEDGRVSPLYAPTDAEGQTLRVNFVDSTSLRLLATSLPESGLVVTLTDADGKELRNITLTLDTVMDAPAGSVLHPSRQWTHLGRNSMELTVKI